MRRPLDLHGTAARSGASRAGLTLVEFSVSMGLALTLLAVVGLTTWTARDSYRTNKLEQELETQAHRSMARIVRELRPVIAGSLADFDFVSDLQFQQSQGYDADAGLVLPGDTRTLRYVLDEGELDNDLDDDGDGLVDERVLELVRFEGTPDEEVQRITRWVSDLLEGETDAVGDENGNGMQGERGFTVRRVGTSLDLFLTLERRDLDGRLIAKTVQTTLTLRN